MRGIVYSTTTVHDREGAYNVCLVDLEDGSRAYTHPGMYGIFLVVEAVRQLREEAGDRQVPGAQVALAHANGGALAAQATAILGTLATL